MNDIFRSSEQLLHSIDEKPYTIFSGQAGNMEKLLKGSLKELNDYFIQQQKRGSNKLQELYVNQFDEEQIWSQMKANDNLINSNTDNLISSVLSNQDQITLIAGKAPKAQKSKKQQKVQELEEDYGEDAWKEDGAIQGEENGEDVFGEGAEDDYDEDEDDDDDEEGGDYMNEDEPTDEEAEKAEMEDFERYLENEDIGLDDEEIEGEEGDYIEPQDDEDEEEDEEGLAENLGGEYGSEDEADEAALRKYQLIDGEPDDEEEEKPKKRQLVDDAELEDDVFERAREDLLADEEEEVVEQKKTRKGGLSSEIDNLEEKLIEKKTWQTQGEIKAHQRPMNSLLEETLDFSITKKASQKITPEYSQKLEDVIKQRILDEAFDDPIEYALPKAIKETFNSLEEINFEKSKKGLGEVYEEKFKTDVMGIKAAVPDDDVKKEIDLLFKKLSYNLDVLSNTSFVPKPSFETTKIVANVASINLEEKTPYAFSNKQAMAPQELFNPKKAAFESQEDLTTAEKKAGRREFKNNMRTRIKEKKKKDLIRQLEFKGQTKYEYNLQQKAKANYSTELKKKNQKSVDFTKSTQFFDNLEKSKTNKQAPDTSLLTKRKNLML